MAEEARVELTGDTTKLDRKVEDSARKQQQLATLTAAEIDKINDALNRKMVQDFDRIGARGAATATATAKPMVKLKEEFQAFSGVALRTGAGIAAVLLGVKSAAQAAVAELEKAQRLKAGLGKTAGDQTIEAVGALSKSGITDISKVLTAAQNAQGPVKQEEINTFLGKLGESKMQLSGDRAADLVKVFARNAPILGDGSSLLAAQKMFPDRTPDALADAAISFRSRTGRDLSLQELREQDKSLADAEERARKSEDNVMKARTGGSMSGLRSAEEAAWQARNEVEQIKQKSSAFRELATPVSGAAGSRLVEMGPMAVRAAAIRARERQTEVREIDAGQDDVALREQMREITARDRGVRRANLILDGGGSRFRGMFDWFEEKTMPWVPAGTSISDRNADAGTMQTRQIVDAIMTQTQVLTPRPELRPDAHDE